MRTSLSFDDRSMDRPINDDDRGRRIQNSKPISSWALDALNSRATVAFENGLRNTDVTNCLHQIEYDIKTRIVTSKLFRLYRVAINIININRNHSVLSRNRTETFGFYFVLDLNSVRRRNLLPTTSLLTTFQKSLTERFSRKERGK
jgi:hypothetical protein